MADWTNIPFGSIYPWQPVTSTPRQDLFRLGSFTLHSGDTSGWKLDCDALTEGDLRCLAWLLAERLPAFGEVEGVPTGGTRLAEAVKTYSRCVCGHTRDAHHNTSHNGQPSSTHCSQLCGCRVFQAHGRLLIVDDVCTTGASMEAHRRGRDALGAVLFARGPVPSWVYSLFSMNGKCLGSYGANWEGLQNRSGAPK